MNSSSFLQTFHNLRCTNMSSLDLQQVKCFTNCKEALTQLRKEFESTCNFNSFMNENTELTQRWISVKEHSAFPSTSTLEHAVQCTRALQLHVPLIFPGAAIRELRSLITRKISNFIAKKIKKTAVISIEYYSYQSNQHISSPNAIIILLGFACILRLN